MMDSQLLLPRFFVIASTIGFRLSTKETGVMKTTQLKKRMITNIQDLTWEMPSSLYIFSHIISDCEGAYLTFHYNA